MTFLPSFKQNAIDVGTCLISYSLLLALSCSQIKTHMEGPPFLLLEAAAEHLAQKLLTHEPFVTAVQLYIRKPHVAVPGPLESLGEAMAAEVGPGQECFRAHVVGEMLEEA